MRNLLSAPSGLVAVGLVWLGLAVACGGDAGEEGEPTDPPVGVTAAQLIRAYAADEMAADDEYKGKTLAVSGMVERVGRDTLDALSVTLAPGEQAGVFSIQCFFDKSRAVAAAQLKTGQRVTLVGRCEGRFGNVMLKGCAVR